MRPFVNVKNENGRRLLVVEYLSYQKCKEGDVCKETKIGIQILNKETFEYEKVFLPLKEAKLLFKSILELKFEDIFGQQKSYYSGSKKPEQIISKIFDVKFIKNNKKRKSFKLTISSGEGKLHSSGAIVMVKKEKVLEMSIPCEELILLSLEFFDLVHKEETIESLSSFEFDGFKKIDENQNEILEKSFRIYQNIFEDITKGRDLKNIDKMIEIGEEIGAITNTLKLFSKYYK